ncbi:PEP-CTERM sorting domain-containing protein [Planctomycetaceae bacterium SH139]
MIMRKIFAVATLCLVTTSARADIVFSTSATDAFAGSDLVMNVGTSASMFVWVSTEPGQTLAGISLDILSSDATILEATSHEVFNPNGDRWFTTQAGDLGDLVDDGLGLALLGLNGDGISTGDLGTFTLFSEVQFLATGVGTTGLSFDFGSQGISDGDVSFGPGDITFGTGSVSSLTAVPEPGSFAVLGLAGVGMGIYRRRRNAKAVAC